MSLKIKIKIRLNSKSVADYFYLWKVSISLPIKVKIKIKVMLASTPIMATTTRKTPSIQYSKFSSITLFSCQSTLTTKLYVPQSINKLERRPEQAADSVKISSGGKTSFCLV